MHAGTFQGALIATSSGGPVDTVEILTLVALLLGAVLLMAIILVAIRKSLLKSDEAIRETGLTLHDLRTMHDSGKITDEEFESMKAVILPADRRAHPDVEALKGGRTGDAPTDTNSGQAHQTHDHPPGKRGDGPDR